MSFNYVKRLFEKITRGPPVSKDILTLSKKISVKGTQRLWRGMRNRRSKRRNASRSRASLSRASRSRV